jgi:hypothetical protein
MSGRIKDGAWQARSAATARGARILDRTVPCQRATTALLHGHFVDAGDGWLP